MPSLLPDKIREPTAMDLGNRQAAFLQQAVSATESPFIYVGMFFF